MDSCSTDTSRHPRSHSPPRKPLSRSEIYPLAGRDFGITCSTGTNWITNAIVGMTFLTLVQGIGPGNTFLLYGAMNVFFIVFFLFLVPETKGVSLEHIERNLMSGKKLREIGR